MHLISIRVTCRWFAKIAALQRNQNWFPVSACKNGLSSTCQMRFKPWLVTVLRYPAVSFHRNGTRPPFFTAEENVAQFRINKPYASRTKYRVSIMLFGKKERAIKDQRFILLWSVLWSLILPLRSFGTFECYREFRVFTDVRLLILLTSMIVFYIYSCSEY